MLLFHERILSKKKKKPFFDKKKKSTTLDCDFYQPRTCNFQSRRRVWSNHCSTSSGGTTRILVCFVRGKIYFLVFRNERWSRNTLGGIIAAKRPAKDDRFFFFFPRGKPIISLSLSLENRWTFTYLTYTFVSTSFWSVENNACSQPLLFPLVSGITSRRMRTRVACNTTVITRKRIVSRGSNGIVRVASQKLDLPRFHASCDPLKRESNLSKTYISFSLVY